MTPLEFSIDIKQARIKFVATRREDALLSSVDLKALVQRRIQTRGEDYNNVRFSPYTPQYAKERQKRGVQTAIVDFTVTGRLFNNIAPIVESETQDTTKVNLGARSQDNRNKLLGAIRKRGVILRPTTNEILLLRKIYANRRAKNLNL